MALVKNKFGSSLQTRLAEIVSWRRWPLRQEPVLVPVPVMASPESSPSLPSRAIADRYGACSI